MSGREFHIRRRIHCPDPRNFDQITPDRMLEVYQSKMERRVIYKAMIAISLPGVHTLKGTRSKAAALGALFDRFFSSPYDSCELPVLPEPTTPLKIARFWIFKFDQWWIRRHLKQAGGSIAPFAVAYLDYLESGGGLPGAAAIVSRFNEGGGQRIPDRSGLRAPHPSVYGWKGIRV